MAAQVLTVDVFVRREVRRQERRLAVLSRDGKKTTVICRRQVEVVEVMAVVQEVDQYPMPRALAVVKVLPTHGNTSAVNDGVPTGQGAAS